MDPGLLVSRVLKSLVGHAGHSQVVKNPQLHQNPQAPFERKRTVSANTGFSSSLATACMVMRSANVRDEPITILRETAHEVHGCGCARIVFHPPKDEFDHDREEIESLFGWLVDDAPGLGRIAPPGDHSRGLEQLQSAGENVRRDRFVACEQLLKVTRARQDDVAEHHQRPFVADEVERAGNWAIGSPRRQ